LGGLDLRIRRDAPAGNAIYQSQSRLSRGGIVAEVRHPQRFAGFLLTAVSSTRRDRRNGFQAFAVAFSSLLVIRSQHRRARHNSIGIRKFFAGVFAD